MLDNSCVNLNIFEFFIVKGCREILLILENFIPFGRLVTYWTLNFIAKKFTKLISFYFLGSVIDWPTTLKMS